MEISKIDVWKTTDGKTFEYEDDALKHQRKLDFREALFNIVDDIYYYDIDKDSIVDGIIEYFDEIKTIMNEYRK